MKTVLILLFLVETNGEYAEGVVFATHMSLEDPNPVVQQFKEAYEAMFGNPPENAFAALGYDTLKVLAKAIEIAAQMILRVSQEGLSQIKDFQGYRVLFLTRKAVRYLINR